MPEGSGTKEKVAMPWPVATTFTLHVAHEARLAWTTMENETLAEKEAAIGGRRIESPAAVDHPTNAVAQAPGGSPVQPKNPISLTM